MGRRLAETAERLDCSERTLRRYVDAGTLRGKRRSRREVALPYDEERYLQRHWRLLSGLRGALRTEHNVRLAVLFGSTATGDDRPDSDVDLLIAHSSGDPEDIVKLRRRLQERIGRPVHLTLLEDAEHSPSLLADVLLEGRVIADRDEIWPRLGRKRQRVLREAAAEEEAARAAAQAPDPRERNKVAVIERELDVLIAYLEELASRALAEGQRLGAVPKDSGSPWPRLAELGVISNAGATRLQNVKDMRNELAHAYPPTSWRALHRAVETLLAEIDRYKVRVSDWLEESGILPK